MARSGNPQSTPRFALASAHPEYESLLRLHDMFPDLPMEAVLCSKKRTDDYLWIINEVHVQTFRPSYLH